jgi:VanZ family protein
MLKKQYWLGLAIAYTVFILVISLVKINSKIDVKVPQVDKIVHFGIYFVFTILWFVCFYSYNRASNTK